jgi:predicted nucleic acid-binding protein
MAITYLIDTNIAVDYLNGKLSSNAIELIDSQVSELSVITRMELLVWPNLSTQNAKVLQEFIDSANIYDLNESIILKAIEIRKTKKCKLPDAIIAATAVVNELILLTNNESDFKGIASLTILNPFTL